MKEYGLYDMTDYEQCVCVGNIKEISKFLNCSSNSLRSFITHRKKGESRGLLRKKYELIEILEDEKPIKSNKEIFEKLLDDFGYQEPKSIKNILKEFEIFDEFKWILKGKLNQVMEFDEEWKQIPGFDYSISNYGHGRNDKNGKIKSLRFHRWIIQTDIYINGKRFTIDVPRMEASLFIRKLDKEERVSYIDGDRRNNFYKNLKIVKR